jgi:lambda family phage portal protein
MFNFAATLRAHAARFVARALDASSGGRRLASLRPVSNLNNELAAGGATVAMRASALYHNDANIRATVDSLAAHLVGYGFTPIPKHPDERVRKALVTLWKSFVRVADPAGRMDLDGLAKLAALSMIRDGECFAIMQPTGDADAPLKIELIHRDQLPLDRFAETIPGNDGNRIRAGIEFDACNRIVAYHFLPARPGDVTAPWDGNGWKTARIPAEHVLHIFNPVEIGQVRGLSWLAPVVLLAKELSEYRDAALVRAKVAAMLVGAIRTPDGGPLLPGAAVNGVQTSGMEPGAMIPLAPGEDVTFNTPPTNADFPEFVKAQLRAMASGLGSTYEQISGDLSQTSFSSARVGLLEFRRKMEPQQFQFAHQFYDPIWRRLVTLAALSGGLDAPDFFADAEAYLCVDWLPPRWDYVNPSQDVSADIEAINAGLKSRAQAVAERGYDIAAIDAERAQDAARQAALGLAPSPNAVRAAPTLRFNENQPRDDHGRWPDGGSSGSTLETALKVGGTVAAVGAVGAAVAVSGVVPAALGAISAAATDLAIKGGVAVLTAAVTSGVAKAALTAVAGKALGAVIGGPAGFAIGLLAGPAIEDAVSAGADILATAPPGGIALGVPSGAAATSAGAVAGAKVGDMLGKTLKGR